MKNLILLLFVSCFAFSQSSQNLCITYIANEGFMLSNGGKSILIDVLYKDGFGKFDPPSEELNINIQKGEKPFDKIDLYLVTHDHTDHYYAPYVKSFLMNHRNTVFMTTPKISAFFNEDDALKDQAKSVSLELGAYVDTVLNSIHLKIFRLKHIRDTTGNIINYAFLIDLNGKKILHPGDILFERNLSFFEKSGLGKEKIDVLFIPYFDNSETSVRYINEVIRPEHIIVMHIPTKEYETVAKEFLNLFPSGIIFKKEMGVINY